MKNKPKAQEHTAAQEDTTKLPILSALCLFLSTIEYMIPKPLPFIRLGLANAPLLLALRMPPSAFFLLVFVKILGQALISGTLFSYTFLLSLLGTTISATTMYTLRRAAPENQMGLTGISIAGSITSSLTQITLARLFILGPAAIYIAPPFLAMSIISGTALGVFCEHFAEKSRWYHSKTTTKNAGGCEASDGCEAAPATTAAADDNDRAAGGSFAAGGKKAIRGRKLNTDNIPPAVLFFAGLFMAAAMLFTKGVLIRLTLFFIFFLAALAVGKAGNLLFTFMFFFVIVFFNTLIPYGKVLCKIGTFSLTEGGLTQGIEKAAAVEGLVMLSRVTISPRLHLPGKAGALLSEAFLLLPRLYEKKTKIHAKTFISDIDKVLLELDSK